MNRMKRQQVKVIALCVAICLSLASYLTLRVLETQAVHSVPSELMAEDVDSGSALPDVQLLKSLMHKTLEFMLSTPKF